MAHKEFVKLIGNKGLKEVERADILKFHQHLMQAIADGMSADTANKKMRYVKDICKTVSKAKEIPFNENELFNDTRFKLTKRSRPPFEAEYVQDKIIPSLDKLNDDAKYLVYAMADTGAREGELVGLETEDIFLDEPIPYIYIRPKEKRELKTPHSERKIPLVGTALHAFQKMPNGFTRYKHADSISNIVNKHIRDNNLKPTSFHTLYSLRHTFKDRLRDIGAPEEVIDQMMGHSSNKPKYGRGHKLETAQMWLQKIAFTPPL
ncbi:tyrosine-type recombinase/integrase [Saccharicrinis aurantiacus]|uniref:tyrosine-type recombinase/integrase n=1 Tax=Saccharicrinis aurantiacus TaxID=1849719 RepID=UPI002491E521|nr:tyrosine-type recombinase/integrase [Saccharicrinis aurantiacus]